MANFLEIYFGRLIGFVNFFESVFNCQHLAEICICIQFKNPSICLDLILIQPQVDILNNFLDATQKFCQLVIPVHSDDDLSYLAKKSGVKIILNFQQKHFCLAAGAIVAL